MSLILLTQANDSVLYIQSGTILINGLDGIENLFLATSLKSEYLISTQSEGVHLDSISGYSAPLHAALIDMEVIVLDNEQDYQGVGNQEVAFLDSSTSLGYNKSISELTARIF